MDEPRYKIISEIETRVNLDAEIATRQELVADIETRQILEVEIATRQEIVAEVTTRSTEDGYYASVSDETLHLLKSVSVDGEELFLNG